MADARYLLRPTDLDYGPTCPECASPKHRQSRRCKDCYYDARRRGEYPPPVALRGAGVHGGRARPRTGGSKGRPQPADHPWRKAEKLRLAKAAA